MVSGARAGPPAAPYERWLAARMMRAVGNPPVRLVLWDGSAVEPRNPNAVATVVLRDRGAFYRLVSHPDLQFGELYSEGRLSIDGDLVELLAEAGRAMPHVSSRGPWARLLASAYLLRRNTVGRARDNIHHHYDIGNDFYRLWLDEQLVYTCAYFPDPAMDLEAAQVAKMDHVCRKLRLRPGEQVVEAGCGWGSLALHMARHYGVRVRAYNISTEQIAHARERARREGLHDRVEYVHDDYRTIEGGFDAFVSVGMLEHVGTRHYRELGAVMRRSLAGHGRGLIHTIGRNRPAPMNAWIEKHIFPGAYPPSLAQMMDLFEPWGFSVLDVENLRLHYALTLRHWLERYEGAIDRVRGMFDEAFVRAWRFYLSGSIAAFVSGELQLFQVLFTRWDNNDLPHSRAHLYTEGG